MPHDMPRYINLSGDGYSRGWQLLLALSDGGIQLLNLPLEGFYLLLSLPSLNVAMLNVLNCYVQHKSTCTHHFHFCGVLVIFYDLLFSKIVALLTLPLG